MLYADYTASGRALSFIEDYVRTEVLPTYGNTHTLASKTGRQSSAFVAEARTMVKSYLKCNSDRDSNADQLLFVGSGATACANHLVRLLGLEAPKEARERARALPADERPVVFVGPYEHHSNLLPWRDSIADVVQLGEALGGGPDLEQLERELVAAQARPLRVGAFSAASNVSGIVTDVDAVTALLHTHNALACWDYASAAPYLPVQMNPPCADAARAALVAKDALFFSPHKLAGGPQTPGVLVFKKSLARRDRSAAPGGGSIFFVGREGHVYLKSAEEREEGGTPAIVGAVRVGLAMQLQHAVGHAALGDAEARILAAARAAWGDHPNLVLLGERGGLDTVGGAAPGADGGGGGGALLGAPPVVSRLPIFALLVKVGGLYLHHNFVVALLSDMFGIQCRGGCMCAGPYSLSLMGIGPLLSDRYQAELERKDDNEVLRPGYVRLSLPYFVHRHQLDFVLRAVAFVAERGWLLLPQYGFDAASGEWHHLRQKKPPRSWLGGIDYSQGTMRWEPAKQGRAPAGAPRPPAAETTAASGAGASVASSSAAFDALLAEAHAQANVAEMEFKRNGGASLLGNSRPGGGATILSEEASALRWFILPSEAAALLRGTPPAARSPFCAPHSADGTATGATADATVDDASAPSAAVAAAPSAAAAAAAPSAALTKVPKAVGGGAESDAGVGWVEPPKKLSNKVLRAVLQHGMLRPGDKVLLGLSGGKDSLTLLHVLHALQRRTPFKWELGACTVDPQTDGFDPSPLKAYLARLGVPYFYEEAPLIEIADGCMAQEGNRVSICSFCSRMKRGILYSTARREGYGVLAMAQHLDDCAESFLMSALHNGCLRSMKAHYTVDAQDLRVIRPLVLVREREAEDFAEGAKLPIVAENCPACFDAPKERYRVKCLLATQEAAFPMLFQSLTKCLLPLMEPGVEDFLRLRREAYGKASGPVHVPPPLPPLNSADDAAAAAAARLADATHGQYNAHAAWTASLALSTQQRQRGGGRGCSARAAAAGGAAPAPPAATEWFGGTIDAAGKFVRPGAAPDDASPSADAGAVGPSRHTAAMLAVAAACCLGAAALLRARR